MKRGKLYACCREHGFNVLLLAQHLDDLAETTMMNLFHNGSLRSMGAHYQVTSLLSSFLFSWRGGEPLANPLDCRAQPPVEIPSLCIYLHANAHSLSQTHTHRPPPPQTSTGDIRVARPLIYVRESMLKKWAFDNGLPVIFRLFWFTSKKLPPTYSFTIATTTKSTTTAKPPPPPPDALLKFPSEPIPHGPGMGIMSATSTFKPSIV